jgi:biopolymer transport protein ExbD
VKARRIFGEGGRAVAQIDMAPLIDMVFILLIFFMVATSFVRESGVDVTRPQSRTATAIDDGFVPVAVEANGVVHVAGRQIPPTPCAASRACSTRPDESGS